MKNDKSIHSLIASQQHKELSQYLNTNPETFKQVIELFYDDDTMLQQRTASFLAEFLKQHSAFFIPYLDLFITTLQQSQHTGIKRNTVRLLQDERLVKSLNEDQMGLLAEITLGYLNNQKEAIAVKVFSMTILLHIAKIYPEIANEVKISIENQFPYGSKGFQSRAKKVIVSLNKI